MDFLKIQVDFVSFKQFPKDSEQPACRDDDLRVDFYWFSSSFPWIFCDSVGFSKIFKGFLKIQVDFVSFKQFPKDSEQPACRDDDLRVDFYWFSSSFPWIFCDSVGFSKIFKDFKCFTVALQATKQSKQDKIQATQCWQECTQGL